VVLVFVMLVVVLFVMLVVVIVVVFSGRAMLVLVVLDVAWLGPYPAARRRHGQVQEQQQTLSA